MGPDVGRKAEPARGLWVGGGGTDERMTSSEQFPSSAARVDLEAQALLFFFFYDAVNVKHSGGARLTASQTGSARAATL